MPGGRMPQATGRADATRAVVFSPLEGAGRAELVEQRITDAIVADLASLAEIDARADLSTAGGARRAVGRFQLEIAAVSQSPRLVHEELRLQAESGPLLWLCLREQAYRDRSRQARLDVIQAIREVAPERARRVTTEHIAAATEWLIDEKVRP